MGYIYKIINDVNDKIYIGQTTKSLARRFYQHCYMSEYKENPITYHTQLSQAIRKYGKEHFSIEQIEECPLEFLDEREQYWINYYQSYQNGYNATIGGKGNNLIKTESQIKFDEDVILIKTLLSEGKGIQEIADIMNISRMTVRDKMNKANIKNPKGYERSKIAQYDLSGNLIRIYESLSEIEHTNFRMHHDTISRCLKRLNHIAYGYKWERIPN